MLESFSPLLVMPSGLIAGQELKPVALVITSSSAIRTAVSSTGMGSAFESHPRPAPHRSVDSIHGNCATGQKTAFHSIECGEEFRRASLSGNPHIARRPVSFSDALPTAAWRTGVC